MEYVFGGKIIYFQQFFDFDQHAKIISQTAFLLCNVALSSARLTRVRSN